MVNKQDFGEKRSDEHYAAWLHELDAWTEYWDIYHPETNGRFYFGNGKEEAGLLARFLPRERRPPAFTAWTQMALGIGTRDAFEQEILHSDISLAIMEVDSLVARLFSKHFGNAADPDVSADYLEAIFRCATDSLPPATERDARIPENDWRKPTAGRHMIDSDIMWFAWAMHTESAEIIAGPGNSDHVRRTLQLAGVATGAAANFAWRGHRRTRPEYHPNEETALLLRERGIQWSLDFDAAAKEVHTLLQIREWGQAESE